MHATFDAPSQTGMDMLTAIIVPTVFTFPDQSENKKTHTNKTHNEEIVKSKDRVIIYIMVLEKHLIVQ